MVSCNLFIDAWSLYSQLAAKLGAGAATNSSGPGPGASSPPSQTSGFGLKRPADFDSGNPFYMGFLFNLYLTTEALFPETMTTLHCFLFVLPKLKYQVRIR